jgi:hypothetical protein
MTYFVEHRCLLPQLTQKPPDPVYQVGAVIWPLQNHDRILLHLLVHQDMMVIGAPERTSGIESSEPPLRHRLESLGALDGEEGAGVVVVEPGAEGPQGARCRLILELQVVVEGEGEGEAGASEDEVRTGDEVGVGDGVARCFARKRHGECDGGGEGG